MFQDIGLHAGNTYVRGGIRSGLDLESYAGLSAGGFHDGGTAGKGFGGLDPLRLPGL